MADLITLDQYKTAEGLTKLDNDDKIQATISSVSELVKAYCGKSFVDYYSTDYTEYFSIDYTTKALQLRETPIVSITSVKERSSYSSAYSTLTTANYEYYYDDRTDALIRTSGSGYSTWAQGPGAVEVIYKGGYSTLPLDLELAVIDLVRYYHKDEYKERQSISSASRDNVTTSTQRQNIGFPDHIRRVLDLYRYLD